MSQCKFRSFALGMVLSIATASGLLAQQTAPNTLITNTISLTYGTGAGDNVTLVDPPAVSFRVDRKVDLLLTTMTAAAETTVIPGTTNAVIAFKLENLGNGTQGFVLAVTRAGSLELSPPSSATKAPGPNQYWLAYGTTDDFEQATAIDLFDPANASSGLITDLASDAEGFVFIVANIAETKANSLQDTFTLTATATVAGTTTPVVESRSANREIENVVLADDVSTSSLAGAEPTVTNTALDGKDADQGRFRVTAPVLSAEKLVAVLDENLPASTFKCADGTGSAVVDPTRPAYLPGGCIAYTITVTNASGDGAVAAQAIAITDVLPTGVTYAGHTANSFTVSVNNATVTASLATLAPGASASFIIRALID